MTLFISIIHLLFGNASAADPPGALFFSDLLMTSQIHEADARAEVQKTQANLDYSKRQTEELEPLVVEGAAGNLEAKRARANFEKAKLQLEKDKLDLHQAQLYKSLWQKLGRNANDKITPIEALEPIYQAISKNRCQKLGLSRDIWKIEWDFAESKLKIYSELKKDGAASALEKRLATSERDSAKASYDSYKKAHQEICSS